MPSVTFRDLTSLDDYAQVVELERVIWGPGYDEVVPMPILAISVLRGGILIGAFTEEMARTAFAPSALRRPSPKLAGPASERRRDASGERMVGFVYSLPGIKHGKATQWSHMLGVLEAHRNDGTGRRLKLLQRERALAMGLELIEWTYDPMQALNAHLNFTKLGVVVEEYEENVYGTSSSPLHRGNPTDRFVAEWWIAKPHVERRLHGVSLAAEAPLTLRSDEIAEAGLANRAVPAGEWPVCKDKNLALDARRVLVEIPMHFTEMLARAPERALEWRMATREIFRT